MLDLDTLTESQRAYLRLVEEGAPSVSYAAKRVGLRPTDIWTWRRELQGWARHEKMCWEVAKDVVRDEVRRRALYGNTRVVLVNGQPLPMRDPRTGDVLVDEDFNPIYVTYTEVSDRMLELDAKVSGLLKEDATSVSITEDAERAEANAPRKVTIEIVRSNGNGGFVTEEL